ncbi:host attachment family protein [Limibaculum sp. FT325]|uniref:baeRF12 domain-containing protein n=1 Tax=Thermohalobaculum sediminis TaxID=2939436 RepID=UPI0020C02F08|nr:host attachment family protein [Limibaculum sediminis]MCL5779057.1 host attachment family protein [Limibaculum sediminis]
MRLPKNAGVIVADGEKYLVLRNHGEGLRIDLRVEEARAEPNPSHTADMGTDRPGRFPRPGGAARETVEETDWKRLAKEEFATSLAGHINAAVRDGTFESLVVVADARTLGVLRTRLDAAAQAAVIREIEGDYTRHPVADIRTMLERAT